MIKASQQAIKRQEIAKYTPQMLEDMTVRGLKRLAAGIVPNASKMKKPQLIQELLLSTLAERTVAVLVGDTPLEVIEVNHRPTDQFCVSLTQDVGDWTVELYKDFRALVQARWRTDGTWDDAIYGDIAGLGYRVIRFLDHHSGEQDDGGLAMTTKMRYRTTICNLLSELVEAERGAVLFGQLSSCLEMLLRQIKIQISDLSSQKKGLQERRLAERKKHKEIISFQPIHEFALSVLTRLDKLKAPDWKKVSIAIAIVTGRRMAEIHLCSTLFEYVDSFHVDFTGQLKVKGDAGEYFELNPSYTIPVLVDAHKVVAAHQWLLEFGKVVETAIAANKRYSGDLSDAMKILKKRLRIHHEFFTYKGLRTIYAQVSNQLFNHNDPDNTLYLAQILGHGRGELLRNDNLTDLLTPQSYNSDFRVVDTECVFAQT